LMEGAGLTQIARRADLAGVERVVLGFRP